MQQKVKNKTPVLGGLLGEVNLQNKLFYSDDNKVPGQKLWCSSHYNNPLNQPFFFSLHFFKFKMTSKYIPVNTV